MFAILFSVLEKFRERHYKNITEFVCDFRKMLENCFRYNGPDHSISKKGQRMEIVLGAETSTAVTVSGGISC